MAILTILEFPDPRLRLKAKPVTTVDSRLRTLIADMFDTMYAAPGIGLAATQVNVQEQIVVMDVSENKAEPLVFINPKVAILSGDFQEYEEGCLSVPGFYESVSRPSRIKVEALDKTGTPFEMIADGLLAICIQHEIDHLEGKLFVDYLSPLKRDRIKTKLEKLHRQKAQG